MGAPPWSRRAGGTIMWSTVLAVALVAGTLAAEPAEPAGADALWRKAVAIVAANDSWTPGTITFTGRETDGRGRTRSSWDVLIHASQGPDGEPVEVIIRYVENGKDVTEDKRNGAGPRGTRSGGSGTQDSRGRGAFSWNPSDPRETPFHPALQDRVTVRRLESGVLRGGRSCVAYAFEQRLGDKDRAVGTAWLDASTGAPVELEATFAPLPPLVRKADLVVRFSSAEDGSWLVTSFHAMGEATILLIHRAYTMDIGLEDHWRLPRPAALP